MTILIIGGSNNVEQTKCAEEVWRGEAGQFSGGGEVEKEEESEVGWM